MEIPCKTCGTPIYWPPESQLQTHLGAWAAPAMCGACKRDAIEAARAIEREALRASVTAAQPGATPHRGRTRDVSRRPGGHGCIRVPGRAGASALPRSELTVVLTGLADQPAASARASG